MQYPNPGVHTQESKPRTPNSVIPTRESRQNVSHGKPGIQTKCRLKFCFLCLSYFTFPHPWIQTQDSKLLRSISDFCRDWPVKGLTFYVFFTVANCTLLAFWKSTKHALEMFWKKSSSPKFKIIETWIKLMCYISCLEMFSTESNGRQNLWTCVMEMYISCSRNVSYLTKLNTEFALEMYISMIPVLEMFSTLSNGKQNHWDCVLEVYRSCSGNVF